MTMIFRISSGDLNAWSKRSYDLSINKYKETEYVAVEYPPTKEIMRELRELEREIKAGMDELERLLGMDGEG